MYNRWFGMRIGTISSLFITIVAFASVPLASSKYTIHHCFTFIESFFAGLNAGLIGLALTYAISLNLAFQFCIRQSAEVESFVCYNMVCNFSKSCIDGIS